jgi:hypothetical protein
MYKAQDNISTSGSSWSHTPVLPGGGNSGQKAQKGPGKKRVGRKNSWPNFGRILPKV